MANKKIDITFNARGANVTANNGSSVTVEVYQTEQSEILDHFSEEDIINHFDKDELIKEIGIDYIKDNNALVDEKDLDDSEKRVKELEDELDDLRTQLQNYENQ